MGDPPDDDLQRHYAGFDEAERLLSGPGRLELARTRELFERYLPPPPAMVLDIGGATGVHAFWLSERGYTVHLVDLVPGHVERARKGSPPLASATVADGRDLPFEDGAADAVLVFGPLYHLTERRERVASLREAHRCLKPGGILLAAAISRFASAMDGLVQRYLDDPDFRAIVARDLAEGQHRNPTGNPDYFTTAYFHHPTLLAGEVRDAGFVPEAILGVEGPAWLLGNFEEHWEDEARRERLLDLLREIEGEPSLVGASVHLLAVGRSPA